MSITPKKNQYGNAIYNIYNLSVSIAINIYQYLLISISITIWKDVCDFSILFWAAAMS